MMDTIFKKALTLNLLVFSIYAQAEQGKEFLANQCYDIAQSVTSLVSSQQNPTCADKLFKASAEMHAAGKLILDESTNAAKQFVENAYDALQYAQYNVCNQYIQISHLKNEAHKLKRML